MGNNFKSLFLCFVSKTTKRYTINIIGLLIAEQAERE